MGTFFKYVFYIALIVVVYLVGKGIYEGSINEDTTVGSVMNQVGEGSEQMAKDGVNAVNSAVKEMKN
ncbi:MAG: hypothetical protein E7012_03490 [Alphaproteobacteria bacterium]|nr:hypothetical protein [Alphaproteobacteria bacterium]